ncbi:hypothetical protein [Catellatospora methionotrophica]|uniref:hypothetical protein n=1 Tax=Catellatospora methionotrophica TaxID=121620 RepID=UPI0033D3A06E
MTTRVKRQITGGLLIAVCVAAAVFAGAGGLEVVSWLAGIGSFLIAVWTWHLTRDSEQQPQRGDITQSAVAEGNAVINQAAGDIETR